MKIAVLEETAAHERRVPIVPDSIKRLGQKKIEVVVESGAGERALSADADDAKEGATVGQDAAATIAATDALMCLRIPTLEDVARMKDGSTLFAPLLPLVNHDLVKAIAAKKITSFAVDFIPRPRSRR